MTETPRERILEAMELQASYAARAAMNQLGQKWSGAPIAGKEKSMCVIRGFLRPCFDMAVAHLKEMSRRPTDWIEDAKLAQECADLIGAEIARQLGIVNPGTNYKATILPEPVQPTPEEK